MTPTELRRVVKEQPIHAQATRRARMFHTSPANLLKGKGRLGLVAYLLGFMVGDASKRKVTTKQEKMFIELELTKRHRTNLRLGEFVGLCANACGIRFYRIDDKFVGPTVPYGRYHWKPENSFIVMWLFARCLGLKPGQLTTWDPVSIKWISRMPRSFRIAFLQGLADSDGYVHLENQEVHLIVSPNKRAIAGILKSLRVPFSSSISRGMDLLKMKVRDAAILPIFNPTARTYRFELMIRLASAERLPTGPWPAGLRSYVENLGRQGISTKEILWKVLGKRNLAIRASNVRRHKSSRTS